MTEPIRVLIADDQALVRGSFRVLVDTAPGLEAVGEAGTGVEAVELVAVSRPDVVLMDIRMPEMDGIEATRRICSAAAAGEGAGPRVLVLTTFDLDEYVYAALRAGASGFLLKDAPPADLLAGIRVVAAGEGLLAPSVTRRLIAEFAQRTPAARPVARGVEGLTEREAEVLTLIAQGLSNPEIAEHLRLRPATVKSHIGHLLAKLGARDRAQLVIAAYESGTVTPATGCTEGDTRGSRGTAG
ncbi:response regulator [Paractinoplanes rishiriensis]|uniref:DNA-binding response regulator n=1 Tax=Paractinoplanes rishiriensis TaxID=1050105 RepID=A0A919K9V5_9ACTN|nr:response regulator transcription factor [Actinoplanes rishiriensis]GIF01398.1 DNA-binding response regulator [Actinoplanes rishiriensis]